MARPLFLPEMVLAGPCFWPNMFFAGPFSHASVLTSFNDRFCDDKRLMILNDKPCAGQPQGMKDSG